MTEFDDQPTLVVSIGASASDFAGFKCFLARASGTGLEGLAPPHPIALTGVLPRTTQLRNRSVHDEPN